MLEGHRKDLAFDFNSAQSAPLHSAGPLAASAAELQFLPPAQAAAHTQSQPTYLYNTLPFVVAAAPGQSVSLKTIMTDMFGSSYGGYKDFWIGYYGKAALSAWDYSYWNPNHSSVATWLVNGSDIGASSTGSFNSVDVTAANIATAKLKAGNDIGDLAYVIVPTAFNASNQATAYDQFSIITVSPSLIGTHAGNGKPTPADIVASANAFSADYSGVLNDNDCHKIACAVAGAAGAAFNDDTTYSLDPSQNQSQGFWRIVYRGSDPHPVQDWQTLVKPGDIVRMGWQGGGQHTTTVLAVNSNGSIKVFDNDKFVNGKEEIGTHNANYDTQTIADTVTIYRLSPDHLYLINGSSAGESLAGTSFNDEILGAGGNDTLNGWTGNDQLSGAGGKDKLIGGSGNDQLTGGASADTLTGGGGKDVFVYKAVSDSTGPNYDTITDFDASQDKFSVFKAVTGIHSAVNTGSLSKSSFNSDLTHDIGASKLQAHHAVLFTASAGSLKHDTFLIVDINGQAGYQANADLVIRLENPAHLSDFTVHSFG